MVILVKGPLKPIIEHIVTVVITIGILIALALMILSVSLLISAKRDQKLFSQYLEDSLINDTQSWAFPD